MSGFRIVQLTRILSAAGAVLLVIGCPTSPVSDGLGPALTGSLGVTVSGLPSGAPAAVTISGPGGYHATITASQTLTGLQVGAYTLASGDVSFGGATWTPTPPNQMVGVVSSQTAQAGVAYLATTGTLAVSISGLPPSTAAAVVVTGPGGFSALLTASGTLTGLPPGTYQVVASVVVAAGDEYRPAIAVQEVAVTAGTAGQASVNHLLATGRLSLTLAGAPPGESPSAVVTGPEGFSQSITASTTLTGLLPGGYTVTAAGFTAGNTVWAPAPPTQVVQVEATPISAAATVLWSPTTGGLSILMGGLPAGTTAPVAVTGPAGFSQVITSGTTLTGLAPGNYTLVAAVAQANGLTWNPLPATQVVAVAVGATASAGVAWALQPGALMVTIAGLPPGSLSAVSVAGPGGFATTLTATGLLTDLVPGSYTISASSVVAGGNTLVPIPAIQSVVVGSGQAAATVTYSPTTGSLVLGITGLPGGVQAAVTATGPGGAAYPATAGQTLTGLVAGTWTVTAAPVANGPDSYAGTPASQGVLVVAGGSVVANVAYALVPATSLNLRIESAYLTQAVQRQDHGVELVAGRDAYLRVFALANEANALQPRVRVRLFHGASEVQTWMLNAPSASVTQAVNEGSLATSWNVLVPGALVVPGLRLLAEVDPEGLVAEANEGDNIFPAGGTPLSVTVRSLLTFQIRLVPVLQSVNGLQGNVNAGNASGYVADLQAMLPIGASDVDVRAVYTTNAAELQSGNANGAWGTILSEVLALRNTVDASSRYYYGVVQTTYASGIAGVGYVGSPGSSFKAAIGWDRSGSRAGVLAHELGHNFGRSHAPCGGPGGPDPGYPHPGGQIGAWGLDVPTLAVKAPTTFFDLMGYCNNDWVSDYTWNAVVNFRAASPTGAPPAAMMAGGADDGLLVWGRVAAAGVVLEPAFRVAPTGAPLPSTGAWRIEGRDSAGTLLFSQRFDPLEVADLPSGTEHHFAMVVPIGAALADRMTTLRVTGPGGSAERRAGPSAGGPDQDPVARVLGQERRQLSWDVAQHPMALVRDASTGEILSFARGGGIALWSSAAQLDVQLSDGVRVVRRRVVVR